LGEEKRQRAQGKTPSSRSSGGGNGPKKAAAAAGWPRHGRTTAEAKGAAAQPALGALAASATGPWRRRGRRRPPPLPPPPPATPPYHIGTLCATDCRLSRGSRLGQEKWAFMAYAPRRYLAPVIWSQSDRLAIIQPFLFPFKFQSNKGTQHIHLPTSSSSFCACV
jgi:hypothetical protein